MTKVYYGVFFIKVVHLHGFSHPCPFPKDNLQSPASDNEFDTDYATLDFKYLKKSELPSWLQRVLSEHKIDFETCEIEHKVMDITEDHQYQTYQHMDTCDRWSILWYYNMEDDKFDENQLHLFSGTGVLQWCQQT